jgi:hypothetical protein
MVSAATGAIPNDRTAYSTMLRRIITTPMAGQWRTREVPRGTGVTKAEASKRIDALQAKLELFDGPPHTA